MKAVESQVWHVPFSCEGSTAVRSVLDIASTATLACCVWSIRVAF